MRELGFGYRVVVHANGLGPDGTRCGDCRFLEPRTTQAETADAVTPFSCAMSPRRAESGTVFVPLWSRLWPSCGLFDPCSPEDSPHASEL